MPQTLKLTPREEALLRYAMSTAATMLEDSLLATCADLEYRVCLLELGIN